MKPSDRSYPVVRLLIDVAMGAGGVACPAAVAAAVSSINSAELNTKSNYQDFQRFQTTDVGMVGDAQASLPFLIDAVKSALTGDKI